MRIDSYDLGSMSERNVQISLAKPNRTVVGRLKNSFDINHKLLLGGINEITFSIPYEIEENFRLVENKFVKNTIQRYLLKVEWFGSTEWYIIADTSDSLNDSNIKQITAYSLAFQLHDKHIMEWAGVEIDGEYRKESLSAYQVLNSVLSTTNWGIGYIEAIFSTRYRAFDFTNITVLDAIFQIGETFNAVITWDDENRKINMLDPDRLGRFKGLRVSEQHLLKSFERDTQAGETATRLKLYGQDGLSIREINPTGTDFIEDFSHYMQGFSMDSEGNVTSSSGYMSDDLCLAIIEYRQLAIEKKNEFNDLLEQQKDIESQLIEKDNELIVLLGELDQIQDSIIVIQTKEEDITQKRQEESQKKTEIAQKESEISALESQLSIIYSQIAQLKNLLSMEENYTEEQLVELNDFIIEKTWENENVTDPEELLELGEKEMEKYNKPSEVYKVEIVHLHKDEGGSVYDINLGDKIRISKRELSHEIVAQIIEINISYDDNSIDLTIADSKRLTSSDDELTKLLYKSISSATTVNLNKNKWDDVSSIGNQVNEYINSSLDSAKQEILSGVNQSVIIDRTGITTRDMDNPEKYIRVVGGVIGLTDDDGANFKTAITAKGIVAERLTGRVVIGQQLYMENEHGHFRFDQDGVTIEGNSFRIIGGDNGVTINPDDGITVTDSSNRVRTTLNATDGIKVQVRKGTTWTNEFYYDPLNERLTVDGEIRARDLKINGESVLTSGNSRIDGLYVVNLNADTINSGTINGNLINVTNINADNIVTGTIEAIDITGSTITGSALISQRGGSAQKVEVQSGHIKFFSPLSQNPQDLEEQIVVDNIEGHPRVQVSDRQGTVGTSKVATSTEMGAGEVTLFSLDANNERSIHGSLATVRHQGGAGTQPGSGGMLSLRGSKNILLSSANETSYIMSELAIGKSYVSGNYTLDVEGVLNASEIRQSGSLVATQSWIQSQNYAKASQIPTRGEIEDIIMDILFED